MYLAGVKVERSSREGDFAVIDIADLLMIELCRPSRNAKKIPFFKTKHGDYWMLGTLEGFGVILQSYGVKRLDSVNLVNVNNIASVKETGVTAIVFFENGETATVSSSNTHKIIGDHANNTTSIRLAGVKEIRQNDESDFVTFDIADLLMIEMGRPTKNSSKQPLFKTKRGNYWNAGTLEGLGVILKSYGVTNFDSVNLVNTNNVKLVKEIEGAYFAFFENGTFATVSKPNLHKIKDFPKR